MARGHQNLIWAAHPAHQRLAKLVAASTTRPHLQRSMISPTATALAVLAKAPTPAAGAKLTIGQIEAALRRGGRQRNIKRRATEIHTALHAAQLAAPAQVADAFGATTTAAVAIISELNRQITATRNHTWPRLLSSTRTPTSTTPCQDSVSYSAPGHSASSGTTRPDTANSKARRNYAGTSPRTIASGKKKTVTRTPRPQPTSLRRPRPSSILRPHTKPRMPKVLRPTPRRRRPPPPSPTRPRQPTRRHPPRLPHPPHPLQRKHGLGPPPTHTHKRKSTSRLTTYGPGVSSLRALWPDPAERVNVSPRCIGV